MKAKKKLTWLWGFPLTLALLAGLLSTTALAADPATEMANFTVGDGTAALALLNAAKTGDTASTWDGSTLTLNGVNFTTTAATAVKLPDDTKIVLNGENTITSTYSGSESDSCGIDGAGSLTIQGTGTLNVTGGNSNIQSFGIHAGNDLTINGGTVTATSGKAQGYSFGIHAGHDLTIKNDAEVTATGDAETYNSYGIHAGENVTIQNDAEVTATGGTATYDSCGIHAGDSVTISGGTVTATGDAATYNSYGIYAFRYNVTISGTARVTATSGTATTYNSYGIYAKANVAITENARVTAISGTAANGTSGSIKAPAKNIGGHTITFHANGGGGIGEMQAFTGSTPIDYTLPANGFTPPAGKQFKGWGESANGAVISGTSITVTDETPDLHAIWTERSYPVTLNTNGATSCDALTTYTFGAGATLPTPTKTGYTFGGWYASSSFTGDAVTAIASNATGAKTFYAKWTLTPAKTPTLGTVSGLSLTYGYPAGSSLSVTVTNSDADHTYTYQWYSNDSNSNTSGTSIGGAFGSSYPILAGKSAGTTYYYCVVTAKRTDNNQTATVTSNAAALTVNKLAITVTAQNKSTRVGQDLAELTYTYSPELVGSDAFSGALATDANKDIVRSDYTITQGTLALSSNYTLSFTGATYSVVAKDTQSNFRFAEATQTKTYGDADFTIAATGAETGSTVTYTSSDTSVATVDNSGTVHILKAGTTTITATASETATYAQATANYALTVNKKGVTEPTVSGTYTYTGLAQTVTLTGVESCMTVSGNTATNAGNHTVTVTLDGNHQWAAGSDGSITWTIAKATITVTAHNQSIYVGDAAPVLSPAVLGTHYTVTGLVNSEALTTAPAVSYASAPNTSVPGTVTINVESAAAPAGDNYNISYVPGTLTISARPVAPSGGGGSSTPTYKVESTVSKDDDGTVSFSKNSAKKGDTVTITVTPDRYYKVDGVTVKDKNGKEIAVTDNGDGTFTFQMPASKVTVEAVFAWDNPFEDVAEDTYYAPAVEWALKNDVTNGTSDTTFSPNTGCTRAQIVTFLWRAAGCPEPAGMSSFTDVSADAYYAKAVAWAAEQGITGGTGDGKFSPDAVCTRSQSMTFIYRSEQAQGGGMQGEWMFQNPFGDVNLGDYYGEAVMWAVANGVTSGTSDTTFSPNATCTRGQIVTFLYRFFVK